MFEDDDEDDFKLSEFEEWFDNNFAYFRRGEEKFPQPSLEAELFYNSVYCPVMQELNKAVRALMLKHYPRIATEHRHEVLEEIDWRVQRTGHKFLLLLYDVVQDQTEGIDLRIHYPQLDEWAIKYPTYRKPRYMDVSFYDQFTWLTEEQKQEMIDNNRKEADEEHVYKEKPRFEFFDMVQRITFRYLNEVQDLDRDGWVIYDVLLSEEYMDYQIRFEFIDGFIEYEFDVEDLKLPYEEYSKKYSERFNIRWEQERQEREQREPENDN